MNIILTPPKSLAYNRPLRAYEGIWRQLRSKYEVTLEVADVGFVPRIRRMVIKEKDMDIGFKILQQVENFRLKFQWLEEEKELRIKLVSRFGLTDAVS